MLTLMGFAAGKRKTKTRGRRARGRVERNFIVSAPTFLGCQSYQNVFRYYSIPWTSWRVVYVSYSDLAFQCE